VSEIIISNQTNRFRGRSEHTLDGKGRLNIPARFRDVLLREYDDRLLITPPWTKCLRIYPIQEWEKKEQALLSLERQQPHVAKMVRYLVGGSVECQSDKNGRILLPIHLRNQLNLEKEIVMNGMLTFFEVWDKETWDRESAITDQDFIDFDKTFNELGMF
jgi:MraZ protein